MKFIIDNKIPYITGVLEPFGEVLYYPGSKITSEIVKDADALIIRTRTICDEKLLSGSLVKFIATATIGYDHIDTAYCQRNNITWVNAPGCNSKSVEQYIATALAVLAESKNISLSELCIGIVGVGNVGSKVARLCELLGMKVLLNDPPRARLERSSSFVSLQQIMDQADIITLHVPLTMQGEDTTWHLADAGFFSHLKRKPVLINSCRGKVTDTQAVKHALNSGQISEFICDCWENEPDIDLELLASTLLATPHIAGYSKDGKANGTRMSIQSVSRYFGLGLDKWQPLDIELPSNPFIEIDSSGLSEQEIVVKAILATYDIRDDHHNLISNTPDFEKLREEYPVRREFSSFTISAKNIPVKTLYILQSLGFRLK
jgi:erythronate-4-phosphate dehydrogenase